MENVINVSFGATNKSKEETKTVSDCKVIDVDLSHLKDQAMTYEISCSKQIVKPQGLVRLVWKSKSKEYALQQHCFVVEGDKIVEDYWEELPTVVIDE